MAEDDEGEPKPLSAPGDLQPVVVSMRGIVKRFGRVTAVAGADLDLRRGEIHALLGENGAGKSTLMNLLYGLERPDEGVITVDSRTVTFGSPHDAIALGIGMVHQHFQLVPRLTVAENVILGSGTRHEIRLPDMKAVAREIEELGDRYGLPIDGSSLVSDISVGEQQRVEILRALYRGARILILDEPTATLTPIEVEQLIGKLKGLAADGAAIVMITHHLDEVMTAADRVTVLRDGANVATVRADHTTALDLARLMVGRDIAMLSEVGEGDELVSGEHKDAGPPILTVENLTSIGADRSVEGGSSARTFADVDFQVRAGEIVTIAGVEGNGQSELEEALLGLRHPASGRITLEDRDITTASPAELFDAGVGFIHSDRYRRGMIRELPVAHNFVYDRIDRPPYGTRFGLNPSAIAARGAELIERFSIAVRTPMAIAGTLSGGNAQKVVLARALGTDLKLLVAAQPTRGLDVGAIEFVWEQLRTHRDAGLAILLLTTDLSEVTALSDRCFVIYRGRLTETPVDREVIGMEMGGASARPTGGPRR